MPYWGKADPDENEQKHRYHRLAFHSLDVAAVGELLLSKNRHWKYFFAKSWQLPEASTVRLVKFLLAIHDLGKFSESFQSKAPEIWKGLQSNRKPARFHDRTRHDQVGFRLTQAPQATWLEWLFHLPARAIEYRHLESDLAPLFAASVCHHGRMPSAMLRNSANQRAFPKQDQEAAFAFIQAILQLFDFQLQPWPRDQARQDGFNLSSFMLAGFAILCDWLGSNRNYFKYHSSEMALANYWQTIALPSAEKAIRETGIVAASIKPGGSMSQFFPNYEPTPLQRLADRIPLGKGPQLFVIEDLTGSGKTEAALVLAYRLMADHRAKGIFVALPTQATADQMFDRVSHVYDQFYTSQTSCILAHGKRHLSDKFRSLTGLEDPPREKNLGVDEHPPASAFCSEWLADSLKKSLLGAIGVGTVDQVMLAAMFAKHQALRLYGLMGKVLILDEIHAYDTYMLTILKGLLQYHAQMGGSAILLSATLPLAMRRQLCAAFYPNLSDDSEQDAKISTGYPLVTHVHAQAPSGEAHPLDCPPEKVRDIRFEFIHQSPVPHILAQAKAGQCVCWIRNTVIDAIEAYVQLSQEIEPSNITLFHARFPLGRRLAIQDRLLHGFGKKGTPAERHGKIIIATQVVEQSLDLDFDQVISDLAPIDLLLQRLGRQMRHPRDRAGNYLENGADQRGEMVFKVYAPVFTEAPQKDWFSQDFPRANMVYQATHRLWLTQKLLLEQPKVRLPRDIRTLIEGVYSATTLPPALRDLDCELEGLQYADSSRASNNTICFELGYHQADRVPEEADDVLTRLGLPTTTLRLAEWTGTQFQPLACADGIWEKSQVRVPSYYGTYPSARSQSQEVAYQALCETLPDRNRRVLFLPMTHRDETWVGTTSTSAEANGEPIPLIYHPDWGLLREADWSNFPTMT